ncbi:hypothetical protein LJR225_003789 [Phenylobacterium sp. LjRoot225]|uniref:hypothetical protein n=1 Tax=Phenylobacterium sp. LjRoot225 TaxID=3342285 RepID=UPI003ECFB789
MSTRVWAIGSALTAALVATSAGAASLDLSRDVVAQGAKPTWSLKVTRGTQFNLTRPGKPALLATAPGAAISPAGASWSAKAADGQLMKVTLQTRSCAIGATQYPLSAQVETGAEILSGCAGYAR